MFITILYGVIPFICIIGSYSAIFLKVRRSKKLLLASLDTIDQSRETSASDRIRKSINESKSQLFRMFLVISAYFFILMVVGSIIRIFSFSDSANVDKVVYVLQNATFVVNPFFYFFMNKNYREAFTQLLPEKLMGNNQASPTKNMGQRTLKTQV